MKKKPKFKKNNICRDLRFGGIAEVSFIKLMDKAGFPSAKSVGRNIEWDIESLHNGEKFTTEVKFDAYEHQTGNLAIEYHNSKQDKPSGIMATKAFFWCFMLADTAIWITKTSELMDYVETYRPVKNIKNAGDGNSCIYLYESSHLLSEIFHRIDILKPKQLNKLIIGQLYKRSKK